MPKRINNGAKSPVFRSTIKPNQMNVIVDHFNNPKLKREMKKFYSKQRRSNFKQMDLNNM